MFFVAFLGSSRHGVGRETSHETDTCEPKVFAGSCVLAAENVSLVSTFVQWNTHEHFPIVAPLRVFLVSLRTVYVRIVRSTCVHVRELSALVRGKMMSFFGWCHVRGKRMSDRVRDARIYHMSFKKRHAR